MFKALKHLIHLARAGFVLARYRVVPDEQIAEAPMPVRLAWRAFGTLGTRDVDTGESRLNAALISLGPSYIKLGQFLATRPDFVGRARAGELSALQDKLPAFSFAEAKSEIERQLGKPADELFSELSEPIAAASIAQVHRARSRATGQELAIKILRPDVEKRFARDLDSFMFAARMLERFIEPLRRLRPVEAVRVLDRSVKQEMDLRIEAAALSEMAENSVGLARFRVPDIDWNLTSARILASEWIDGTPLNNPDALGQRGIVLPDLAEQVVQTFLVHAIKDGFFHADMHQGNLFVDGKGNLVAVDLGITGRLTKQDRRVLAEILYGFIKKDYRRVAEVHFEAGYVPADQDVDQFAQMLRAIGEPIMDKPANEISMGRLLGQLLEGTERFNMRTQPQLILLQKTMVVVEGVARSLDPDFNMWAASEPVVAEWIERRIGPVGALEDLADGLRTLGRLAAQMPDDLERRAQTSKQAFQPRPSASSRTVKVALTVIAIALTVQTVMQLW